MSEIPAIKNVMVAGIFILISIERMVAVIVE